MAGPRKTADLTTHYDEMLSRPFLAEHWYKGFIAAVVSLFLLMLLFASLFDLELYVAALAAVPFSLLLLVAAVMQHKRFELDASNLSYRKCLWVLGIRFGRWYPLPGIEAVIVRHRPHQHFLPVEESPATSVGFIATEDKWQVLLRVTNSPVGLVAAYVPQSQALTNAAKLGKLLGVAIIAE